MKGLQNSIKAKKKKVWHFRYLLFLFSVQRTVSSKKATFIVRIAFKVWHLKQKNHCEMLSGVSPQFIAL